MKLWYLLQKTAGIKVAAPESLHCQAEPTAQDRRLAVYGGSLSVPGQDTPAGRVQEPRERWGFGGYPSFSGVNLLQDIRQLVNTVVSILLEGGYKVCCRYVPENFLNTGSICSLQERRKRFLSLASYFLPFLIFFFFAVFDVLLLHFQCRPSMISSSQCLLMTCPLT